MSEKLDPHSPIPDESLNRNLCETGEEAVTDNENNIGQPDTGKAAVIQIVKFTLLSITAAVVEIITFAILNLLNVVPFWFTQSTSVTLSVLYNFTLNRHFTFKSANNVPLAMLKVALFYVFFIPLTSWSGQLLANAGWADWVLKAMSMILNFIGEFLWWKFFVFRGSENTNDLAREKARLTKDQD